MSDWQRTLNIVEPWKQATAHEITAQQLAAEIHKALAALKPFGIDHVDEDRDELLMHFDDFASETDVDFDDLDELMALLYDWADRSLDNRFGGKKVCWVKTF